MYKLNYLLTICIFAALGFTLSNSQGYCPPYEEPAMCADICNRCEPRPCPYICIPGCQCIPGFTRDSNMNCIPRSECPGMIDEGPREMASLEEIQKWEDNQCGCPDEMSCKRSCRRRGLPYTNAVCTGPNRRHCLCLNCSTSDTKYSVEAKPVSKNGCPNLAECNKHCEKTGQGKGVCIGPRRLKCHCTAARAEDFPLLSSSLLTSSLLSPNTVRGGCPVATFCNVFCNSRGFRKGLCLGPRNEYCNCYEVVSSPRLPVSDAGKRIPGRPVGPKGPLPRPKPPGVPGSSGCPDIGKCIASCQAKGQKIGFCTGTGRRECKCSN